MYMIGYNSIGLKIVRDNWLFFSIYQVVEVNFHQKVSVIILHVVVESQWFLTIFSYYYGLIFLAELKWNFELFHIDSVDLKLNHKGRK